MTAADPSEHPLTAAECRDWLAGHDEARLGYETGCGHRDLVVTYALDVRDDGDDEILLALPEYSPAVGYVLDAPVTVEVDGVLDADRCESVRVAGVAHPRAVVEPAEVSESWPAGVEVHPVGVPLTTVDGVVRATA